MSHFFIKIRAINAEIFETESFIDGLDGEEYEEVSRSEIELVRATTGREKYGEELGKLFFRGKIERDFDVISRGSNHEVYVTIAYDERRLKEKFLSSLRWNLISAQDGAKWTHLRLHQKYPFAIHIPRKWREKHRPIERESREKALLFVSNATWFRKGDDFDASETAMKIYTSMKQSLQNFDIDVLAYPEPDKPNLDSLKDSYLGPATLSNLRKKIGSRQKPYQIIHIVCHGEYSAESGESLLFIQKDIQQIGGRPIKGSELRDVLSRLQVLPSLVFLSSCESGASATQNSNQDKVEDSVQPHGVVAHLLAREGIRGVIAMTDRISLEASKALVETFYRSLWESGRPALALNDAATEISEKEVCVPVLFSNLQKRSFYDKDEESQLTAGEIVSAAAQAPKQPINESERVAPEEVTVILFSDGRNDANSKKNREDLPVIGLGVSVYLRPIATSGGGDRSPKRLILTPTLNFTNSGKTFRAVNCCANNRKKFKAIPVSLNQNGAVEDIVDQPLPDTEKWADEWTLMRFEGDEPPLNVAWSWNNFESKLVQPNSFLAKMEFINKLIFYEKSTIIVTKHEVQGFKNGENSVSFRGDLSFSSFNLSPEKMVSSAHITEVLQKLGWEPFPTDINVSLSSNGQ